MGSTVLCGKTGKLKPGEASRARYGRERVREEVERETKRERERPNIEIELEVRKGQWEQRRRHLPHRVSCLHTPPTSAMSSPCHLRRVCLLEK